MNELYDISKAFTDGKISEVEYRRKMLAEISMLRGVSLVVLATFLVEQGEKDHG